MIHLIYVSSARVPFTTDELHALLEVSCTNNEKLGITGMLLYKGGNFLQILEGEEQAVTAMYDRVRKDPRHHDVTRILQEPIAERFFAEWSMGFGNLDDPTITTWPGYSDIMQTPLTAAMFVGDIPRSLRLLRVFKQVVR